MRAAAAVAAAALAAVLAAAPASGQGGPQPGLAVSLKDADTSTAGRLRAAVAISGSAYQADRQLPQDAFRATVEGRPARVLGAVPLASTGQQVSVMLAIDTSGSMRADDNIARAQAAAQQFADRMKGGARVGVVAFSTRPRIVLRPTTDIARVKQAVAGLQADGETALLDAVVQATALLVQEPGQRNLVLLSDGADTASTTAATLAVQAAKKARVHIYTIGLSGPEQDPTLLRTLAADTDGRAFTDATASELLPLYDSLGRELFSQYTVDVEVPPGTPRQFQFALSVTAGGLTASAQRSLLQEAVVPAPSTAPEPRAAPPLSRLESETGFYVVVALAGGSLLLLAITLGAMRPTGKQYRALRQRLSPYSLTAVVQEPPPSTVFGASEVAGRATELAESLVRRGQLEQALLGRIEAAGLKLRVAEYVLVHLAAAVLLPLLLFLLTRNLIVTLLGVLVGTALPFAFLSVRASQRQAKLDSQLPDILQLLGGALQAGHSLPQAIDTVVQEADEPISLEFRRVLNEARLGMPVEEALENMAKRIESKDFTWTVMAINLQRQIGGNLAEVLNTVAQTIRERYMLRRQVRTLSAEGRLSALILSILPLVVFFALLIINPSFLAPLYTTTLGLMMLAAAAVLMALGIFWLKKTTEIKV